MEPTIEAANVPRSKGPRVLKLATRLRKLGACEEATLWARKNPSASEAWEACERGDWMLWLAARLNVPRPLLVLAACACAREALPYVRPGDLRPLRAIETAEAWARGEATIEQVRAAYAAAAYASAAAYAYASAAAYAYASAAYAAAYASAYAAAYASAAYAAYAAYAAAAAADAADAAGTTMQRRCADIVRQHLTAAVMEAFKARS